MADNDFGVLVQMQSEEIKTHCEMRATYHKERAVFYLGQADEITKKRRASPNPSFDQESDEQLGYGKFSNSGRPGSDPVTELHAQSSVHRAKAERFRFVALHVIPDKLFKFRLVDLAELEIG